MNMNDKKKLMILGGSRYIIPLIKEAHKLGIFVITVDYLPNNYAHRFSDRYENISILDKEKVLQKAMELKIDGISSFACDPGVVTAAYVAEQMNLPSPGPYESICILQNKGLFREFLAKNNFNCPTAKQFHFVDDALRSIDMFRFPVIVKPTDSAGSKGVRRVEKKEDIEEAIRYALKFSHSNEFIIEDFLTQVGCSSDADSFSIDGEMVFYNFSSQMFDSNCQNPYTPSGYYWPSTISNEHIDELKSEIQRLVSLLKLKTSCFNIETRECTDGKAYIMELSPRGGGNRLSEMVDLATNAKLIKNHVKYCVGLPLDKIKDRQFSFPLIELILHSEKEGVFDYLYIDDQIKDNIIEKDLWIESGTIVGGFSGANEAIGTLVIKCNNEKQMHEIVDNQQKYVKVILK